MPMEMNDFEQLPHSIEAEQSVLGVLLLEPNCISDALQFIQEASFYLEQHQKLFSVLMRLYTQSTAIDIITVLNAALKEGLFENEAQGKVFLNRLMDAVPSVSNLSNYCEIVRDKYYIRQLIQTSREIMAMAVSEETQAQHILDVAEQKIYEIRKGRAATGLVPIAEVINYEFDHLDKLQEGVSAGLPSGYQEMDRILNGLNPSDLLVVAARPAMGKTSFALNIASNAAMRSKKQVAVFSLEMSSQQLVERMLSSESRIASTKLHAGTLESDEWSLLAEGAQRLSELKLYFDDTPSISIPEMKAKLRRLKDLGLVVIDYLQLMSTGRRDGNRVQEISEITRNLKIMAKELDVPVMVLSQLARGPESRQDHRPMLADLRESGAIEQDADIVIFLYRDEYYHPETEKPGMAECIIAKNRHGETGTIELGWNSKYTRFTGLDVNHHE